MKWLYLLLDLGTWFFPVILSFDKNVQFIQHWKNTIIASTLVGIPFIIWDIYFTKHEIWQFNPSYTLDLFIFNLPIEEVLFFLAVPFACIFIYECCKFYLKAYSFHSFNRILLILIFCLAIFLLINSPNALYTNWVFIYTFLALIYWSINLKLSHVGISFAISLIPFLIVNGILTGIITEAPVVIYNDLENSQFRLFTIPIEDVLYSFTLIVSSIITFENLNRRKSSLENHSKFN